MKKNFIIYNFLSLLILILVTIISLSLGSSEIDFFDVINTFVKIFVFDFSGNSPEGDIILNIRLPRILLAMLVGGALALSGFVFQTIFRNPLADPYILGISSGASLGAVISIFFISSALSSSFMFLQKAAITPIFSFIFGLLTLLFIFSVSYVRGKANIYILLLSGVVVSFFTGSLTMFLIMISDRVKIFLSLSFILGNLSNATYSDVLILLVPVIAGFFLVLFYAKELNALTTGEELAQTMGVDSIRLIYFLIFTLSLIVGVSVSFAGAIGFVGIMIPHAGRLIFGQDARMLVPISFLGGSIFLILSDALARVIIAPAEIPVGIVTAFFGAPFFLLILFSVKKSDNW